MKRAVITGPTGAVGTALIEKLVDSGIEVTAICRRNSKRIKNIKNHPQVQIEECNLNELLSLKDVLTEKYDIFYHFAWDGTFGEQRNDMYLQSKNIQYTLDAVELAKALGCEVFVGAGSQAEYGRVEGKLEPETPAFPENGYGIGKLCAGQMSRIQCQKYGIRHIWARILSVYGPYDGEKTMVMSTIKKLLDGEIPEFTKGEQKWDYLYSKDAANMLYSLGISGRNGEIYCLGSGEVRPLYEYIYDIQKVVNPNAKLEFGKIPYGDRQVMYLCADTSGLQRDTGVTCQYSFLEGIKETFEWYKGKRK